MRATSSPRVERLAWPEFRTRFQRRFNQGDHVTILGGPDAGKTHMAVLVSEMRAYSFFIATKPRDPLILRLHQRGWAISQTLDPMEQLVEVTDARGKPVANEDGTTKMKPLYPRFVYWPQPQPAERATLVQQADFKAAAVDAALVRLQYHGSWSIIVDETNYMTQTLRLRRQLSELWHTARSNKQSIIANAQRPSWIPREAVANPGHFVIFQAADRDELKRLGEITGGLDWRPISDAIASLNWRRHEFLYINTKDRTFLRSIAVAW